ncbi:hypothetical protein [Nonomuraea jabiensis]|uniref:hypothetical protein n=1 Tax=Nonomuraea jabiensis TaxID=882448 RepID=UPI00369C9FC6
MSLDDHFISVVIIVTCVIVVELAAQEIGSDGQGAKKFFIAQPIWSWPGLVDS